VLIAAVVVLIFNLVALAARTVDLWLFVFLAVGSLFFGSHAGLIIWTSKSWRGVAFDGKHMWIYRGRGESVRSMRAVPVTECQLSIHPAELEVLGSRGMTWNGSALILWLGGEWLALACARKLDDLSEPADLASTWSSISVTPGSSITAKAGLRL
jgi:hypothetical protein